MEIYRLSVVAIGMTPKAAFAKHELTDEPPVPSSSRLVTFDESPDPLETPIYDRALLKAGAKVAGPAVIEQLDSTVLVPPGITAEVDPWLTIIMRIPTAEA